MSYACISVDFVPVDELVCDRCVQAKIECPVMKEKGGAAGRRSTGMSREPAQKLATRTIVVRINQKLTNAHLD